MIQLSFLIPESLLLSTLENTMGWYVGPLARGSSDFYCISYLIWEKKNYASLKSPLSLFLRYEVTISVDDTVLYSCIVDLPPLK